MQRSAKRPGLNAGAGVESAARADGERVQRLRAVLRLQADQTRNDVLRTAGVQQKLVFEPKELELFDLHTFSTQSDDLSREKQPLKRVSSGIV
ncbi:hypothetical protein SDC9_77323 [bioreactor metagenome]|uniref:Uncharacterized protein n=1 Tax=bioreactor metagenome TaxID=1076179 RepID=A0A644YWE3_9ZZZZ